MNLLELTSSGVADAALGTVTLLLAAVALVASWRVARRAALERRRISEMHRDLQVFAEASTRVADTVDHMLRGDVEPLVGRTSSRRYQLLKARERMEQGESVDAVAASLDLCEDERRLLDFLHRSNTAVGQRARVA